MWLTPKQHASKGGWCGFTERVCPWLCFGDIGESYGVDYQLDGGADDDSLEVTSGAYRGFGRIDPSLEGGRVTTS